MKNLLVNLNEKFMKLRFIVLITFTFSLFTHFCSAQFSTMLSFNGANGNAPAGALIQSGNVLYGTTNYGGANGNGTVYSIHTDGTNYIDLFDFYGAEGYGPNGLVLVGNKLYGTTSYGGANGIGNIFSIDTNGGGFSDMYDFNNPGPSYPFCTLTYASGKLYGTTSEGGSGAGSVFSIDTNGSNFRDLFDLNYYSNGGYPYSSLIISGNKLYGTTYEGGPGSAGTVFSIDTDGSAFNLLVAFNYTNGGYPYYSPLLLSNGVLYGMSNSGGSNGAGTLFSVDTDGSGFSPLFNFSNTNGAYPLGGLVFSPTRQLWGVTNEGGASNYGTIFSIDTTGSRFTDRFDFGDSNGAEPLGALLFSGSTLYGVANIGGAHNDGTIYTGDTNCLIAVTVSQHNIGCGDDSTVNVVALPTGGKGAYTYLWTDANSQTTDTAHALAAGSYTVSVVDHSGSCSASASITVTLPTALSVNGNIYGYSVYCNGGSNYVYAQASGGNPLNSYPYYTYTWTDIYSNVISTYSSAYVSAGTYTVATTDGNGCTATTVTTITQPTALYDSLVVATNVSCNGGSDGSATIGVRGGTPSYNYQWSDPNNQTTATATGLSAGTYTVTIIDNNSCGPFTTFVTITQPTALNASITSQTNVLCSGGSNGKITAAVSGGVHPYTYSWAPSGGTALNANYLSAGTYTITATDHHGCTGTASATITAPAALRDSLVSITGASCFAQGNGYATIGAIGGTTPYTYLWSPNISTISSATDLSARAYTCFVKDNNGCGQAVNFVVTQPAVLKLSATSLTQVSCSGATNGSARINVVGGTTPYTYLWSPGGITTATATGLSAGTYTIAVTDSKGCAVPTITATIGYNPLRDSISSITENLCGNESSGAITVGVKGGVTPYTYAWSNGKTAQHITLLSNGTYSVSVTDKNGCSVTASATITSPAVLAASLASITEITCFGARNGSAGIAVAGGVTPYTYIWSPNISSSSSASGLACLSYICAIEDKNGCRSVVSFNITQPAALTATISASGCTLSVNDAGGTSPYTYLWTPGGQTSSSVTEPSGTYTVTVTDYQGCSASASRSVSACPPSVAEEENTDKKAPDNKLDELTVNTITVYPNPSTGQFTIAGLDKDMIIEIYDYTGKIIRTVSATDNTMQLNIANQANGIYLIRILSKNGTLITQKKLVKTQ